MAASDRTHWDKRWEQYGPAPDDPIGPPPVFADYEHFLPAEGRALEIACGRGRAAVWLAARGLSVLGLDISPVAIGLARALADRCGLSDRCAFEAVDLDDGIPGRASFDVVLCHMFRDPRLDRMIVERLAPGGVLFMAQLSEVDAGPGRFRVPQGGLARAFADLEILAAGEGDGQAWLIARAG